MVLKKESTIILTLNRFWFIFLFLTRDWSRWHCWIQAWGLRYFICHRLLVSNAIDKKGMSWQYWFKNNNNIRKFRCRFRISTRPPVVQVMDHSAVHYSDPNKWRIRKHARNCKKIEKHGVERKGFSITYIIYLEDLRIDYLYFFK